MSNLKQYLNGDFTNDYLNPIISTKKNLYEIKEDKDSIIGNQTRVKVVKNKMAPPFKQVEFDIMYGEGISKIGEIIDLGVQADIIDKSGAWYAYKDEKIGQGRENTKQFLREHPEILDEIESRIRSNSNTVEELMIDPPPPSDDSGEKNNKE